MRDIAILLHPPPQCSLHVTFPTSLFGTYIYGRQMWGYWQNFTQFFRMARALQAPLPQPFFFNHLAATTVTEFSETLSLAENSLSLARKSLSLVKKSLSLTEKILSLARCRSGTRTGRIRIG